jgi:hypothetical protein
LLRPITAHFGDLRKPWRSHLPSRPYRSPSRVRLQPPGPSPSSASSWAQLSNGHAPLWPLGVTNALARTKPHSANARMYQAGRSCPPLARRGNQWNQDPPYTPHGEPTASPARGRRRQGAAGLAVLSVPRLGRKRKRRRYDDAQTILLLDIGVLADSGLEPEPPGADTKATYSRPCRNSGQPPGRSQTSRAK